MGAQDASPLKTAVSGPGSAEPKPLSANQQAEIEEKIIELSKFKAEVEAKLGQATEEKDRERLRIQLGRVQEEGTATERQRESAAEPAPEAAPPSRWAHISVRTSGKAQGGGRSDEATTLVDIKRLEAAGNNTLTVRARRGRLSALSVSHRKSAL
jgi:hypothetical protein